MNFAPTTIANKINPPSAPNTAGEPNYIRIDTPQSSTENFRRVLQALDQPENGQWSPWATEEPIFQANILKAANSGFLGNLSKYRTIEQLQRFVEPSQCCMLALTAGFSQLFQEERSVEGYSRHFLWRHCVATAHVAETIARITEGCSPLDAFSAGLCHDIGWLRIESAEETRWQQWLVMAKEGAMAPEQEASFFPLSHADVGYEFLRSYDAPHWITATARFHHRYHLCDLETQPLVGCITVANYLVSRQGWTSIGVNNAISPAGSILRQLGITALTLRLLWSQLSMLLDEAGNLANSQIS